VGGVAVVTPHAQARVVGPLVQAGRGGRVGLGSVAYPADGSIVAAASLDLRTSGCGRRATAAAVLQSVSLFGGAVTARTVRLAAGGGSAVAGLEIGGRAVAGEPGRRVRVGGWAYAVTAPPPVAVTGASEQGALALHLLAPRAGLRAGTTVLVAFAAVPAPAKAQQAKPNRAKPKQKRAAHRRRRPKRRLTLAQYRHRLEVLGAPLKRTPPLGLKHYVFPVAGQSDYVDTYGAFRGDVPGNWHHGDDIFAALGTPVVAVASGTLNRVGWEHLGGWRLWVRDSRGNEFYYAHLSGYSPLALHSTRVKAGEVLGFVGNTGDAFTTSPHLHFEVHPHQLLWLDYNGAVDPTTYLNSWRHLSDVHAPRPVHPQFPPGQLRKEASYVWRELLASRGLIRHAPSAKERPKINVPGADNSLGIAPLGVPRLPLATASGGRGGPPTPLLVSLPTAMGVVLAGFVLVRRRRRDPDGEDGAEPTVSAGVGRLATVVRSLRGRE
jgi:murein DD-endopeptidase MepM/ murein hydrolase activator NlpD